MVDETKLLKDHQTVIFWLELAGLLHDIGKLRNKFIEYRRTWQREGGEDPHEGDFLSIDPLLQQEAFSDLCSLFKEPVSSLSGVPEIALPSDVSIKLEETIANLVKLHIEPGTSELGQILKAADGKDSAEDRNNPLLVNEQNSETTIFKASVFGYETPISADLHELRQKLYESLQSLLCNNINKLTGELRRNVHRAVYQAFTQTVSDTCRPANDIVLWEHSYATATLFKVLIAHFILYGEKLLSYDEVRFSLWGVGWDGVAFYSSGQRVGDVVGRRVLISEFKKKIREKVEWDFNLGNAIYDDDNGVYFIIPEAQEGKKAWLEELKHAVEEVNRAVTENELPIFFSQPKNTNLMVPIVAVINEVKRLFAYPCQVGSGEVTKLQWISDWEDCEEAKEICPICRKRHLPGERTICEKCERIRKLKPASSTEDPWEPLETVYHSEIALGNSGQNGKLAMIIATFDLEKWLDGTMLYTSFVKEARSLDAALRHLGQVNDKNIKPADEERIRILKNAGVEINDFEFDHEQIRSKVGLCRNPGEESGLARAFLFLFDRHFVKWDSVRIPPNWHYVEDILDDLKSMGKDVPIANYLVTKNHSPSRLLRIWNGTRDFFIRQSELLRKETKDERGRIRLKVIGSDAPQRTILKGVAKLLNQTTVSVEVVREGEAVVLVDRRFDPETDWNGAVLELTTEEFKKGKKSYMLTVTDVSREDIVRARTVTASPDIFLAVVPANRAVELSARIYENYRTEFGKVYGRLPFSMGVLYFNPQMPMFVVLDGARRMIKNFDRLSQVCEEAVVDETCKTLEDGHLHLSLTSDSWHRRIDLSLPAGLGNKIEDYFHPYFMIEHGDGLRERKSYFETAVGSIVHYLDLKKGDQVRFYPNFFDFEFLDSTTRRFDLSDINMSNKKRGAGPDRRRTRPVLLEELEQGIEKLWKALKCYEGMTDSKLRNLASLFCAWEHWREETGGDDIHNSFIQTALRKELPNVDPTILADFLRDGLFFDSLELHFEILKERIGEASKH